MHQPCRSATSPVLSCSYDVPGIYDYENLNLCGVAGQIWEYHFTVIYAFCPAFTTSMVSIVWINGHNRCRGWRIHHEPFYNHMMKNAINGDSVIQTFLELSHKLAQERVETFGLRLSLIDPNREDFAVHVDNPTQNGPNFFFRRPW